MNTDRIELFTSLLALIALGGSAGYLVVARWPRQSEQGRTDGNGLVSSLRAEVVDVVREASLWLAWVVAAAATAGSLYFSEVAHYVPCQLCWFQRICMYPMAGILFLAALRGDRSVRWYCLPLLIAGAILAAYHYVIEWKPAFGENLCSVGPSCTDLWFRRMGFVTLALMSLIGFMSITVLLFVEPNRHRDSISTTQRSK